MRAKASSMRQRDFDTGFQVDRRVRQADGYGYASGYMTERRKHQFSYPDGQDCGTWLGSAECLARFHDTCCTAIENSGDPLPASDELFRLFSDFQERERRRVATDLHDSIGASLTVVKFRLEQTIHQLAAQAPAFDVQSLRTAAWELKQTIEEVRRIAMNLKPAMLDDLGLIATMNWYCRELASCYQKLKVEISVELAESDIPPALKTTIFRILQEASNNTIKHSGATLLRVTFVRLGRTIRLSVEDNGKGFVPASAADFAEKPVRLGGVGMRQRVKCSGGSLTIASTPGVGTIVVADWPIRRM